MKRQLAIAATLSAFIGVLDHAIAQAPARESGPFRLPRSEYMDARESLARAVLAEEGWHDPTGHAAVVFVYSRKWSQRRKPGTTLKSIVENHCAALRPNRDNGTLSDRARIFRSLPAGLDSLAGRRESWERALTLLDKWYAGRVKDPCAPHKPTDFGSAEDRPPVGAVRVHCEGVDNRYYEIRR